MMSVLAILTIYSCLNFDIKINGCLEAFLSRFGCNRVQKDGQLKFWLILTLL